LTEAGSRINREMGYIIRFEYKRNRTTNKTKLMTKHNMTSGNVME
jgi:hypothetical protein